MNPVDILLIAIIAAVLGGALWYIIRSKKQGNQCIGCPHSKSCSGCAGCHGTCGK